MDQDTADSGGAFTPAPLDDILRRDADAEAPNPTAGQPVETEPTPPPAETGVTDKTEPGARDPETGRFVAKEAEPETGSPPAEQKPPPQFVPAAVLAEERRKWQAKVRELEARVAQPAPVAAPVQQQPTAPAVPLPDLMFQDPDRFVAELTRRQEDAILQTRIATSQAVAQREPDYADAEAALEAYARSSAQAAAEVAQNLRSHPAPAMWALEAGRHLLRQQKWAPIAQQHADPEAFIEAEIARRMAARTAPAPASSNAPPPKLPGTLADARSAGSRTSAQTPTVTPLEEIVRFR